MTKEQLELVKSLISSAQKNFLSAQKRLDKDIAFLITYKESYFKK